MSFSCSAANSHFYRTSGNVSNTNALTHTFWFKRKSNFSGTKYLGTMRPTGETDGHDLIINDPGSTAYTPILQANFATAQAIADDPFALDAWVFGTIVGSGGNLSLKYWDGTVLVTKTVGQTSFVPNIVRWGGSGYGSEVTGLFAHLRSWNAALSDADLNAERLSATRVRTANFLSAHSGGGGTIAVALTGESGTAYVNGGVVTYDADQPTFSSFSGSVISGDADMPSAAVGVQGARYNRILHSGSLSNAAWAKQTNELVSGAVVAPGGQGTSQRVLIKVDTGGVYQLMTGLPSIRSVAVMAARRVDTDYIFFRHLNATFNAGVQGYFNLSTGEWGAFSAFGGTTGELAGNRALGNGYHLFWLAATISGNRILEFYPTIAESQVPAVGKYVDVCGFQYEDVVGAAIVTFHKPTTSTVAVRVLASVTVSLGISTIGTTQTTTATAQLLDDAGSPWDQYGAVTFASSDVTKATVGSTEGMLTDLSGRMASTAAAVANGTTSITATAGGITSAGVVLTVSGTAQSRWVRIFVEAGWQGTAGWQVGVYEKHSTGRFPRTWLFEASSQKFENLLAANNSQSYMDVPVPAGVTVTLGQVVEVVIENDNFEGKAVDGPGIFPATVI